MGRQSPEPNRGWTFVAIAALAQNCAIGLNFAAYGTMIGTIEARFDAPRALVASGPGAFVLALSLCSPLVGGMLQRLSVRRVMTAGALLCAVGYAVLPLVHNVYVLLLVFGCVIGPGGCLLGIVPASTLVGNWFVADRGKALGIINMPILLLVTPPVFGALLPLLGLNGAFLLIAAVYCATLIPLSRIIDRPEMIGLTARGAQDAAADAPADTRHVLSRRELLGLPRFWMLSLAVGLSTSGGTMIVVHFVPFGMGRGLDLSQAALLISAFGGAGMIGALLFGWLVDHIGAVHTLVINALAQALLWLCLFVPFGLPLLLVLAAAFGTCAGAIIAIHGAAINELFGRHNFSQAMGLSYLLKLPFIVGAAPLAGWLFDRTHTYSSAFGLHIGAFVLAAGMFLPLRRLAAPPSHGGITDARLAQGLTHD